MEIFLTIAGILIITILILIITIESVLYKVYGELSNISEEDLIKYLDKCDIINSQMIHIPDETCNYLASNGFSIISKYHFGFINKRIPNKYNEIINNRFKKLDLND